MPTLKTELRTDLQDDLDIGSDETVFTNDELQRLYDRAGGDYDTTVALALTQMVRSSAKRTSYAQNQSREDLDKVYMQLKTEERDAYSRAGLKRGKLKTAALILGLSQEDPLG